MKKLFKKAAVALLAAALVGGVPLLVPAVSDLSGPAIVADAAGSCYEFNAAKGILTLTGNVERQEIMNFSQKESVTEIVADPGTVLPYSCDYMFSGYTKCKKINLSSASGTGVFNMSYMFMDCQNLEVLYLCNFPDAYDMNHMFAWCSNLKSIDMSRFNGSKPSYLLYMFYECSKLESVDLSVLDTSHAVDMQGMFSHCSALTSVDLSGLNTSKVTDMKGMFNDCSSLSTLDLSSFSTGNVIYMNNMFSSCSSLTSVKFNLSRFDTSKVTNMTAMFAGCSSLKSLNTAYFATDSLELCPRMFQGCSSLETLDLSCFKTGKVTDASKMFDGCSNLTTLKLSGYFNAVTPEMQLPKGTLGWVDEKQPNTIISGSGTYFTAVPDARSTYVRYDKIISDSGFTFNINLRTLTLNGNVVRDTLMNFAYKDKVSDITSQSGAVLPALCPQLFYDYKNCRSIDLSNADTSKVTDMGLMFGECIRLTSIDLNGIDTSNVTNMSGMFSGCESLTSLYLNSFNTKRVTDMSGMFEACISLRKLDLSSFDTSNVRDMSGMFWNCSSLFYLDLGSFKTNSLLYTDIMFESCTYLVRIYVDNTWKMINVTSSDNMFSGCTALEGQNGTKYDSSVVNKDYARIDRSGSKGYLSSVTPEFVTNSMTLGGSIALNFYVVPGIVPMDKFAKSFVTFTVNGKSTTVPFNQDKMNSKKTAYGFLCPLNSVSMADNVFAELQYTDASGVVRKVTAVTNCENYMKKVNASHGEKLRNLIKSINDYGYYMQQYLSVYSAAPWTIGVDHRAMEKAYTTHQQYKDKKNTYLNAMKDMKKVWGTNQNIEKVNYSLVLDSDTAINFKIKKKDGYTGKFIVKLDGKEVTPVQLSDGRYQVTASGIPAHLLSEPHTVTVTTNSGTTAYKASVLSYAYECMGVTNIDSEYDAMCALYEYYKATVAYKNS